MHRAMLSLMVAAGLTYTAFSQNGPTWLYLASLPLWVVGVWLLLRGRRQLMLELRRRQQSQ